MIVRFAIWLSISAALSAAGCSKSSEPSVVQNSTVSTPPAAAADFGASKPGSDSDLIRQAVEDHVRNDRGINLSAMDMSVDTVDINGDKAQARASFRVKQGGATMQMVYFLERHGKGWLVLKDEPAEGQFVHPPMDRVHSGLAPPSSSAAGMPDVHEFLQSHPATSSQFPAAQ